jgi:hypothetical protein
MVIRTTTWWDRAAYMLRREATPSTVAAAALTGFVAGLLDASGRTESLLTYVLIWMGLTVVMLAFRQRGIRLRLLLWALRSSRWMTKRRSLDVDGRPSPRGLVVQTPSKEPAPATTNAVLLTSTPDPYYIGSFRSLVDPARSDCSPLIVTPCNPRDISRQDNMLYPVVAPQGAGTPVTVSGGRWGEELKLIRQLPRANDDDHSFASRDVCYLAELGGELTALGTPARPLCMPEHCVDIDMLAEHDLVILSGPDTNFWHAVLYETVALRFEQPSSSIPLALSLRDTTTSGTPIYGSSDMFVHLKDVARATAWRGEPDTARLAETVRPTCGMILATSNPLADPASGRWCVFLAGLRSLGTMAATLCFTSLLRALRTDEHADLWSLVPLDGLADSYGRVAAALVRADVVEAAADTGGPRARRSLPHDRPDPDYRDSYVVKAAEVLDTTGEAAIWRPVDLDRFPSIGG